MPERLSLVRRLAHLNLDETEILDLASDSIHLLDCQLAHTNYPDPAVQGGLSFARLRIMRRHHQKASQVLPGIEGQTGKAIEAIAADVQRGGVHWLATLFLKQTNRQAQLKAKAPAAFRRFAILCFAAVRLSNASRLNLGYGGHKWLDFCIFGANSTYSKLPSER